MGYYKTMKKCAIYSRVSTSMQAEVEYNSCEAQKDRIHSYIKSQEDLEFFKEYSGRLLRNIMLTFAQFEREMTSERIKDKFQQKALKGLWNGNLVPLGYKSVDKKLVVDQKNAKIVKELYEIFIETGSFKKVMEYAREIDLKHPQKNNPLSEGGFQALKKSRLPRKNHMAWKSHARHP